MSSCLKNKQTKKKTTLIGPYQKWLRHQLIALEINTKGKELTPNPVFPVQTVFQG